MELPSGTTAPFLQHNLKPAHLPMSDNEDTTEEPYSQSYHDRISQRRSSKLPSTLDDLNTESILHHPVAPSPKQAETNIQNKDSAPSGLQIVSVCSLPPNSDLLRSANDDTTSDDQNHHHSQSEEVPSEPNNKSDSSLPDVRRVFGIAQVNVDDMSQEESDSDSDQLLVEQTSKQETTTSLVKPRKGRIPMPKKATSKLLRMREKLNKRFARQNITHASRAVLDSAMSSANTTDGEYQEDSEENSEESESLYQSKPSLAASAVGFVNNKSEQQTSRTENRRKTTHQPICSDEMEFLNDDPLAILDDVKPSIRVSSSSITRKRTAQSPLLSSARTDQQLDVVRTITNPNADLMKKVAFLRTCVNYMLKELGRGQLVFSRGMTLSEMKAHYHSKQV